METKEPYKPTPQDRVLGVIIGIVFFASVYINSVTFYRYLSENAKMEIRFGWERVQRENIHVVHRKGADSYLSNGAVLKKNDMYPTTPLPISPV